MTENSLKQGSEAWLALRKTKVGASDVSAICGVNPYKTRYKLWQEKTGLAEPVRMNAAMQHGIDNEEHVRVILEDKYELSLMPKVFLKGDHYMASLDAIDFDGSRLFEIKCPGEKNFKEWSRTNIVPDMYLYQILFQMYCSGVERGTFVAWYQDELLEIEVLHDTKLINDIVYKCEEFCQVWKSGGVPEPDEKDYVYDDDSQWAIDCAAYVDIDTQIKLLDKDRGVLGDKVKAHTKGGNMENEMLKVIGVNRKGVYDMKAIAEHFKVTVEELDAFRKAGSRYQTIKPKKIS